jgi:hypothetical protein
LSITTEAAGLMRSIASSKVTLVHGYPVDAAVAQARKAIRASIMQVDAKVFAAGPSPSFMQSSLTRFESFGSAEVLKRSSFVGWERFLVR